MNILVLQHKRFEHPGIFRSFLEEDGHQWTPVYLDEGDALPPLEGYDALWVLGGPMNVWDEAEFPWLVEEKAFIREAVAERGLPFLGLCLGHQLLAEALGGSCGQAEETEVGVLDVQLTEVGASGVFMDGLPETFKCLQWHGAEVQQLPPGARCLATSPACTIQAMQWETRAYSLQFHVEIEADTVDTWNQDPTYAKDLKDALGEDGPAKLEAACAENMKDFNNMAERLYINWLQTAAQA